MSEIKLSIEKSSDKEQLVAEQKAKGFALVEDQIHKDGHHLIFASAPRESQIDWKTIYAAAKTDSERIAIIAQKLGLA